MFDLEHAIAKEDYGRVFKSAFASTPCKCLTDIYLSHCCFMPSKTKPKDRPLHKETRFRNLDLFFIPSTSMATRNRSVLQGAVTAGEALTLLGVQCNSRPPGI